LPSQVLVDLTIELSAGMATLDLNELILSRLTFTMGAGQGTVYLPTEGIFDATINSGLGKLTIYIPSGMAVKFDPNIALVSPRLPASNIRQGD